MHSAENAHSQAEDLFDEAFAIEPSEAIEALARQAGVELDVANERAAPTDRHEEPSKLLRARARAAAKSMESILPARTRAGLDGDERARLKALGALPEQQLTQDETAAAIDLFDSLLLTQAVALAWEGEQCVGLWLAYAPENTNSASLCCPVTPTLLALYLRRISARFPLTFDDATLQRVLAAEIDARPGRSSGYVFTWSQSKSLTITPLSAGVPPPTTKPESAVATEVARPVIVRDDPDDSFSYPGQVLGKPTRADVGIDFGVPVDRRDSSPSQGMLSKPRPDWESMFLPPKRRRWWHFWRSRD